MTPARALRLFRAFLISGLYPVWLGHASAQEGAPTPAPPEMTLDVQNVSPPPPDQIPEIDPIALYGDDVVFDIYRKKTKVGEHRARFTRNGEDLSVVSTMSIAVDVLFFTAYSFEYEATEVWRNGALQAIAVNVNDNGKIAKVNARMEDDLFKIDGPRGSYIGSSWVFPTNHWHRGQANSRTILNTLTGKLTQVDVVNRGIQRVETAQGSVDADHFEYTGQLRDTEVWYDAQNRWVKMRFKANDGTYIEYRCRQCGLAPGAASAVAGGDAPAQPATNGPS
jgi:hypothetical protein